ncbi:nuclear transport factor 2 family protein [Leucobacter komagatae]|uniref:Polyketide cyclase n=1 Tax=Leucobacter komagatae TaxID=55969 RepID=A0A0D0IQ71_9MICO|nr:nuclear transport factor 2 family protein [Leucobacter komagatae]KIP53177.1 polyketide cyclase [Leucobacter komagatae]
MYATVVRRKVHGVFDEINAGNYAPMVNSLGSPFTYRFLGRHALGGRRTSVASMNAWWERLLRLLPGARFEITDILVGGWPWRTRIGVRSQISGPLPDGSRYENTVFQFMTLSWGKVVSVETCEDLQVLERALRVVADSGNAEAAWDPIED